MFVRFVSIWKRLPTENGMSDFSTRPSSNTSPVRISRVARNTVSGFMWLPAPRWSAAPHFDGQRWASVGGHATGCAMRRAERDRRTNKTMALQAYGHRH